MAKQKQIGFEPIYILKDANGEAISNSANIKDLEVEAKMLKLAHYTIERQDRIIDVSGMPISEVIETFKNGYIKAEGDKIMVVL